MTNELITPQQEELCAWLTLIRAPGLGPKRVQSLLQHFDHPKTILQASLQDLKSVVTVPDKAYEALRNPDQDYLDNELSWLSQAHNHLITLHDPLYPSLLKQIADPPPVLFVNGNPELLSEPQIAIVGSRNPDHYGLDYAFEFANALSKSGLIITSGLALGIDGAGHRGALDNAGETIAVVATGLDRVYPAKHRDLAHEIARTGAIVSEQPLGTPAAAHQFPRRNRIISGLSLGTFVVQAALQSGSLITARMALEQDREVFALPGSVHNPLSRGCHVILRQGAKLVETTQDILEELAPQLNVYLDQLTTQKKDNSDHHSTKTTFTTIKNNEIMNPETISQSDQIMINRKQQLLSYINFDSLSVDTLVEKTQLSSEIVISLLLELELAGVVQSSAGLYSRK